MMSEKTIEGFSCQEGLLNMTKAIEDEQQRVKDYQEDVRKWEEKKEELMDEYQAGHNPATGTWGNPYGGSADEFNCEGENNYATRLGHRDGNWLNQISVICKNGTRKVIGDNGGYEGHVECPNGISKFKIRQDQSQVYRFIANCGSGWSNTTNNLNPDNKDHYDTEFDCPTGTVLKKIKFRKGHRFDQLSFVCGPKAYKPGNWPDAESYAIAKLGPRPTFEEINLDIGNFVCQDCRNIMDGIDMKDVSQSSVNALNSCVSNIGNPPPAGSPPPPAGSPPPPAGSPPPPAGSPPPPAGSPPPPAGSLSDGNSFLYLTGGGAALSMSFCCIMVIVIGFVVMSQ